MAEFPSLTGSWPWPLPWIGSYCTPSCITHRPLRTYRISLKSKKVFVDGRTDGRTDGPTLLGRLGGVDLTSEMSSCRYTRRCSTLYFIGQRSRSRVKKQCRRGSLHSCESYLVLASNSHGLISEISSVNVQHNTASTNVKVNDAIILRGVWAGWCMVSMTSDLRLPSQA